MKKLHRACAWLIATVGSLAFAGSATAVDGVIEINDVSILASGGYPFTITSSGSYVITSNLTPPAGSGALVVTSPAVEIDLNGHHLIGAGGGGDGISAPGVDGLVVKDGQISGFGGAGIVAGPHLKAFKLRIGGNSAAGIASASDCIIVESVIDGNLGDGIDAFDCKIENNIIKDNGLNGILGSENVVIHNKIVENGQGAPGSGGILSPFGSTIQENVLVRNSGFGISDSSGAPPGPVPMPAFPGAGFPPVPPGTAANNIMKNVVDGGSPGFVNAGIGIYTNGSALITDNTVTGWTFDGIVCGISCTVRGNQVNSNNASGGGNGGMTVGPGSTVHANSVSFNVGIGLVLSPATGWSNNTFDANTAQDVSQVVPIGPPAAAPHPSAGFDNFCSGAAAPVVGFGPGTCP